MATSSSLSTPSSSSSCHPITNQEFNAFHAIDRTLYTLLILTLDRYPSESMRVMGLLLWLERNVHNFFLVKRMLSMKSSLVNSIAEETVICLKCIESDGFQFEPEEDDIPLLRMLLGSGLSLRYFHENRVSVLRGVMNIVSEVCARAFEDIIRHVFGGHSPIFVDSSSGGVPPSVAGGGSDERDEEAIFGRGGESKAGVVPFYPGVVVSHLGHGGLTGNVAQTAAPFTQGRRWWEGEIGAQHQGYTSSYDVNEQRLILNEEMGELLGSLSLHDGVGVLEEERDQVIPPDDRTIFLTFSKGYPISENEVRDFFTRKYGEIFEAIHMQEVGAEEQVLYARLVAVSASTIRVVLGDQRKARFSINGKHVWARKYIKKHPKSPSNIMTTTCTAASSPPSPPQSSSPAAALPKPY